MARESVEDTVERLWGEGAVVDIVMKSGPFGLLVGCAGDYRKKY